MGNIPESQAVKLAPLSRAKELCNMQSDKDMIAALESYKATGVVPGNTVKAAGAMPDLQSTASHGKMPKASKAKGAVPSAPPAQSYTTDLPEPTEFVPVWGAPVEGAQTAKAAPKIRHDRNYPATCGVTRRVIVDMPKAAKPAAEEAEKKLAREELAAIREFTATQYVRINRHALADNPCAALDTGLEIMPGYLGPTARGISGIDCRKEYLDKWRSGEWARVEWKAYSSSVIAPWDNFGYEQGILFLVENKGKQGSYVAPISSHMGENECLYKRGARFRVKAWDYDKHNDAPVLLIEELEGELPEVQDAPPRFDFLDYVAKWRKALDGQEGALY